MDGTASAGRVSNAVVMSNGAVHGLRVTQYDIPTGCVGGYYPELNPLIPLWHHAKESQVPAAKSIPIRLQAVS